MLANAITRNNNVIEIFSPFSTFVDCRFNAKGRGRFLSAFVNEASTCRLDFFNHSATFTHGKFRTIVVLFHILSKITQKKEKGR